jgi:hypothetical protein
MPREGQQILSLPRMPFRHPGAVQKTPERLAWGWVEGTCLQRRILRYQEID